MRKDEIKNIRVGLYPHKCKQCGKAFECRPEYAYKIRKAQKMDQYWWFCSHKCIRKYDEGHTNVKMPSAADQRILDLLAEGNEPVEVARMLGITYNAVSNAKCRWGWTKEEAVWIEENSQS